MADTSVQGIGDYLSYIRTDYPSSTVKASALKSKNPPEVSFDDVMTSGFAAAMNVLPANQTVDIVKTADLMNRISVNTSAGRVNTSPDDSVRTLQQKTTESALQDAVQDAGQEMVRKTSEVLNVPEETVEKAMTDLGMNAADLLNPENLSTLTMEITGTTDTELLTNDALYQDLQTLMDTASELTNAMLDEFLLSDIQLTTAIENLSAGLNADLIQTAFVNPETIIENPLFSRVEAPETAPRVDVDVDEEGGMVMQEEELMQENAPQNLLREATGQENEGTSDSQRRNRPETERVEYTNAFEDVAARLTETVSETYAEAVNEAVPAPTDGLTQAEDILRQMTEFIRVEATPDTTTMELSLHPQSLGNVMVQISEGADGNMTARFLTQNETVREALELQLAQLQQRFDEQGLKVTEISVTVESHAFEQNLQQGAGDPNTDRNAPNASGTARTRRIRFDDDELNIEGIDGMSEAEVLAADMMARNGNTLDYMA